MNSNKVEMENPGKQNGVEGELAVLKPGKEVTDFLINDRDVGAFVEDLVILVLYEDWIEAELAIAVLGDEPVGDEAMKSFDVYDTDGTGAVAADLDVFEGRLVVFDFNFGILSFGIDFVRSEDGADLIGAEGVALN